MAETAAPTARLADAAAEIAASCGVGAAASGVQCGRHRQKVSALTVSPWVRIITRCMVFSSSRTLPGQG